MIARTAKLFNDTDGQVEERSELASKAFRKAVNIREVFEASDEGKLKKRILIGLNRKLSNKKVVLVLREPLNALHETSSDTIWRARPDLNRRSPP